MPKNQKGFTTTTDFRPGTMLGKIVHDEMRKRGWSQNELAHRAGLSQPSLRDILTGATKNPRMDVIAGLAKAFGLSELYLMGREHPGDQRSPATALTAQATSFLVEAVETLTARVDNLDKRMAAVEALSRSSLDLTETRGRYIVHEAGELAGLLKQRGQFLSKQAQTLERGVRKPKKHRSKKQK